MEESFSYRSLGSILRDPADGAAAEGAGAGAAEGSGDSGDAAGLAAGGGTGCGAGCAWPVNSGNSLRNWASYLTFVFSFNSHSRTPLATFTSALGLLMYLFSARLISCCVAVNLMFKIS